MARYGALHLLLLDELLPLLLAEDMGLCGLRGLLCSFNFEPPFP